MPFIDDVALKRIDVLFEERARLVSELEDLTTEIERSDLHRIDLNSKLKLVDHELSSFIGIHVLGKMVKKVIVNKENYDKC